MSQFRQIIHRGRALGDLLRYALSGPDDAPPVCARVDASVLRAATRSGSILVVEAELPRPDRDAGSRILVQLLRSMVDIGMRVYFLPANPGTDTHYASSLKQLGVTALSAPRSREDWSKLKTLAGGLDFIWLCRPLVAARFVNFFRRHSTAQLLYYPVDLHYVRDERHYQLHRSWSRLARARLYRWLEYSLIAATDAVLCLSHEELQILSARVPKEKLRWVPPHVAQPRREVAANCTTTAAQQGVIFVGNFRHSPNEDAMRWFLQSVWPIVQRLRADSQLPAAQLQIVGAAIPAWLHASQSPQIQLHANVSDHALLGLYKQCGVAVAPLRFGAGIKGKVLEAMELGIPVVTTSTGLEGLPDVASLPPACDDAETFAAAIVRLLSDRADSQRVARAQRDYLQQHFSPSAVREQLCNVLAGGTTQSPNTRGRMRRSMAAFVRQDASVV